MTDNNMMTEKSDGAMSGEEGAWGNCSKHIWLLLPIPPLLCVLETKPIYNVLFNTAIA